MKRKIPRAIRLALVIALASPALAQFKDQSLGGGLSGGARSNPWNAPPVGRGQAVLN